MKRIFTLTFFNFFILMGVANAQCTTPATCAPLREDFNVSAGGFTSSDFTYNNSDGPGPLGNFQGLIASGNNTPPKEKLTSGDFAGASTAIVGFSSSGVSGSFVINVRNASTDVLLATCTVVSSSTACVSITNAAISNVNVYFEFIFDNSNGSAGGGTLTFDDFRTNLGDATALPVTFISFDAKKANTGTQLTWKVGTENNVKIYEIEKNVNGAGFTRVGFVTATGASSYSFTDAQSSEGTVLYRVRNVDLDGKFKYSTTLNLRNGMSSVLLRAFPLPARNLITLQHATASNNAKINIASPDGRNIKTLVPSLGAMQTDINLTGLKAGIYLLRFSSGNGSIETLKLVKQ